MSRSSKSAGPEKGDHMPEFFASIPKGLADVMAQELEDLGVKVLKKSAGGVSFETNWEGCYRVNLASRYASKILKPVLEFPAYQPEDLYHNVRKHDFTKYIDVSGTLAIDAKVQESKMRDQRYIALKIKDAIVDQFREKTDGIRPNVDSENPDMSVYVRGSRNNFVVALDTSGDSLFKRGYKQVQTAAPLKENLAAALVALSGWDRKSPIVDPMCGSGTILIEAALMAQKMAPGMLRKHFGFQKWKNFDRDVWNKVVQEQIDQEIEIDGEPPFKLYGYDMDRKTLEIAKENAHKAGVDHWIEFRREPLASVQRPSENAIIITNPPYGARIGEEDMLVDLYKDLAYMLKAQFQGSKAFILSGNRNLIQEVRLKSTRKHFIFNGPIECRFLEYDIRNL